MSTTSRPDDLAPWHDADTLLQRLYQIGREPVPALREPLLRLTEHEDPDLREEALRILGTRWKDPGVRPRILAVIGDDPAPEVRSAALIALAACASDATRITDTRLLVRRLADEGEHTGVRGAAYDALIIMYRKKGKDDGWPFPTARCAFDPVRDVDWDWVRSLGDGLPPPDSAASGA
jgi:HEAT repeat protein